MELDGKEKIFQGSVRESDPVRSSSDPHHPRGINRKGKIVWESGWESALIRIQFGSSPHLILIPVVGDANAAVCYLPCKKVTHFLLVNVLSKYTDVGLIFASLPINLNTTLSNPEQGMEDLVTVFQPFVASRLGYCYVLDLDLPLKTVQKVQLVQSSAAGLLTGISNQKNTTAVFKQLHWL